MSNSQHKRNSNSTSSSGRSSQGRGSNGPSGFAALFRNVLRSPFTSNSRGGKSSALPKQSLTPSETIPAAASSPTHKTDSLSQIAESSSPSTTTTATLQAQQLAHFDNISSTISLLRQQQQQQENEPADRDALTFASDYLLGEKPATSSLDVRIEELQNLATALADSPYRYYNISGVWQHVKDLAGVVFGSASHPEDTGPQTKVARVVILQLLVALSRDRPNDECIGKNPQLVREEILRVISASDGWDEVSLAVQCAVWASNNARELTIGGDPSDWLARAQEWITMATEMCYPEMAEPDPLRGSSDTSSIALTAAIEFLSRTITNEYPVLDPQSISDTTWKLCTLATQPRLCSKQSHGFDTDEEEEEEDDDDDDDEVTWMWNQSVHMYSVLRLLKTVIKYGALSPDLLNPSIMLLCTTVHIPLCKSICCDITCMLFTSCYMRDTLLTMNSILSKGNTGLSAIPICDMTTLTPYQVAVNGMVYFITQVMEIGSTGFQFSLRAGNCLPVLDRAAQCMHPEVLQLVFPYLCQIIGNELSESLLPEDWNVVLSILDTTIDCRLTDKYDHMEPDSDLDESMIGDMPKLGDLYDQTLTSIVRTFSNGTRTPSTPPTVLVDLLLKMREVLSDDLAVSMLRFIDARGSLRPSVAGWKRRLEELMQLYYFDRSRSIALRRYTIMLCVKTFTEATEITMSEIGSIPFIMSVLEQLHLEVDTQIIDSVIEMLCSSLKRTKNSTVFREVLDYAVRAAVEPEYQRPTQMTLKDKRRSSATEGEYGSLDISNSHFHYASAEVSPLNPTFHLPKQSALTNSSRPVLKDEKEPDLVKESYPSYDRVSRTVECLLEVLEWRIAITGSAEDKRYAQYASDTVELVDRLLDFLECEHTFPSIQRDILSLFLRLHADSSFRLYIMGRERDTVMDQRVSLHENARLRLAPLDRKDSSDSLAETELAQDVQFPIRRYVNILIFLFQTNTDIDTFCSLCKGLTIQLGNTYLFSVCQEEIKALVSYLINFLKVATYRQQPKLTTRLLGTDKKKISAYAYGLLMGAFHYRELVSRDEQEAIITAFKDGLVVTSSTLTTPQTCLNALTVAMLELPSPVARQLTTIMQQLVKIYSAEQLSRHLLEFSSSLAREQKIYANIRPDDYRMIFSVAINYIRFHNNQRRRKVTSSSTTSSTEGRSSTANQSSSGGSGGSNSNNSSRDMKRADQLDKTFISEVALSQYVLVMAYQVIDFYYMSLQPAVKKEVLDSLILGLLQSNYSRESLDEPTQVCLDMVLQNYSRSSSDILSLADMAVKQDLGSVVERSWMEHNGIVTIRAETGGSMAEIMVRSPSGTISEVVNLPEKLAEKHAKRAASVRSLDSYLPKQQPQTPPLPSAIIRNRSISRGRRHPMSSAGMSSASSVAEAEPLPLDSMARLLRGELLPQCNTKPLVHFPIEFGLAPCLAQEFVTAYKGMQHLDRPVLLPTQSEAIARTLRVFDNTSTIDTHKVSVVYVGPGQTTEREILLNQQGSPAYWNFLRGLGNITRLSGLKGFAAGLDTSGQDSDGRYAIRWRDLIAQQVFHVGTLMPARADKQEQIIRKKAHMGNDYVQIVFNESGREYEFNTIPSQFNFVQIIVTPVDGRTRRRDIDDMSWMQRDSKEESYVQLYKVRTQVHPDVPFAGPASDPKLLTLTALPAFVRSISMHAAILSQVYTSCNVQDLSAVEHISPWRARLHAIKRIRASLKKEVDKEKEKAASNASDGSMSSQNQQDLKDFGVPITDISNIQTASQALGYIARDLESFYATK